MSLLPLMYMDLSPVASSMISCFDASEIEGGACRSTSALLAGIIGRTDVLQNEVVSFGGGSQTTFNVLRSRMCRVSPRI